MVPQPRWLRTLAAVAVTTLITSSLSLVTVGAAAAADSSVDVATTSALPTPQIDGVVWTQVVVGNTVYVGGSFTTAQPAGAAAGVGTVARANMLAYDLTTGQLISSFNPVFNAQVRGLAASPDGSRIYAVGTFTAVNGVGRNRVVALNPGTGAIIPSFRATANAEVLAVAATADAVYLGGWFSAVDGASRTRAAAVTASDGSILPWAPVVPDRSVRALVVSPDASKVVLGGSFLSLNGSTSPGRGSGMVDATTGTTNLPWGVGGLIYNGGDRSAIWSLSTDGTNIYGTGYVYGKLSDGNLEGAFNASWNGGAINWVEDCHGDSYGASAMNGVVYVVGHPHACTTVGGHPQTVPDWTFQRGLAFSTAATGTLGRNTYSNYYDFAGQPAPSPLSWYPDLTAGTFTGQSQAAWSVTTAKGYVLLGGEFPSVNGVRQTGLVRFATRSVAPDKDGPRLGAGKFVPNAVSNSAGTATVTWRANYDRDDSALTYEVYRNGNMTTPVYTTTGKSRLWFDRPALSFTDTGLTPGATYYYRLRAIDPGGNAIWGDNVSVTVSTSNTPISAYDSAVVADGASNYWRLADAAGSTTAFDSAGADDLVSQGGLKFGGAGPVPSSPGGTAATFDGTASGFASTQTIQTGPQTFSIEGWFRTTSTTGGVIAGFGDNKGSPKRATSTSYDRHIEMNGSGAVSFGVYDGKAQTISTGNGLNDGKWHYAVGTLDGNGMQFFVDGRRIGTKSNVTSAQDYYGYWRVGGDSGWSSDNWFDGDVANVAVYPKALSPATVNSHWSLAGGSSTDPVPTDAYGAAVYNASPDAYWRLNETGAAATAKDSSGNGATGAISGGVTLGGAGAVPSGTSAAFDGSTGQVVATRAVNDPEVYSLELWFKTRTTSGGRLIGFGDAANGPSNSYDRQVWMLDSGQLEFGTWTGQTNTITSSGSYNDGAWHQVVATQGADGLTLSVDGKLVGTNPQTRAQPYTGYWRVGGDNTWGGNSSSALAGSIDEVAIYGRALTASDIADHYALGTGSANKAPTASFSTAATGLTATFDASASADPDGSIASYAWDFGDGVTGTGAKPQHTYAKSGTYTVTLTVTDDRGATGVTTRQLAVAPVNQPPTASFSASSSSLTTSVDASASSDADGTVASYAWDFGDGSSGSGVTDSHTYAKAGTYTVRLTVTDDQGATGTTTRDVTVAAANASPTASFTVATNGLAVTADGSASTDSDGTVASYAWDFGDGATGQGATAQHTYTAAGTFTVRLTVTDDRGATDSTTRTVTVGATAQALAQDSFSRSVSSGLGTADTGGPWTVGGVASNYSVAGGTGVLTTAAGKGLTATLTQVAATDEDVQAVFGLPKLQSAGMLYLDLRGRQAGNDAYAARVTVSPAGAVTLLLVNSAGTLAGTRVSGLTLAAGDRLHVRLSLAGTSPTALGARVWKDGAAEPTQWQVTASDSRATLQQPGAVAVATYLAASATGGPLGITLDDLLATTPAPTGKNAPPVAAFTASVSGLDASFDAGASTDPDGTVARYEWDFGDGTTGTGATPKHTYAAAGDHTVRLTVTDDAGATDSTTKTVTTTAPPPPATGALAADAFGRTVTGGFGTADTGGPWTVLGDAAAYSVDGSRGVLTTAAGKTLTALLRNVSAVDTDTSASFGVVPLPSSGSAFVVLVGRAVGSSGYSVYATVGPTGAVTLYLMNGSTSLQATKVNGLTLGVGDRMRLRLQVTGTSPTTLRARAWKDGTTEPTDWQISATDSTAALQAAGFVGVRSYLSAATGNGPVSVTVDDLAVRVP